MDRQHLAKGEAKHEETGLPLGIGWSTHRVEALADGIFAIAMTLLVLDVHLPPANRPLQEWLGAEWPTIFAYALSFVLLGVYWVSHHGHFQYLKRADRILLWINIFFFMFISFIPFTASLLANNLLSESSNQQISIVIYGVHLMIIGSLILLHWWYGTSNPIIAPANLDAHLLRSVYRRILISPAICLVAIAFAFVLPIVSIACYTLIPIVYIFPGSADLHWTRRHTAEEIKTLKEEVE